MEGMLMACEKPTLNKQVDPFIAKLFHHLPLIMTVRSKTFWFFKSVSIFFLTFYKKVEHLLITVYFIIRNKLKFNFEILLPKGVSK